MIREATEGDIPGIARVFIAARTTCLAFLNWEYDQDVMCDVFGRQMAQHHFLVDEVDGEILGFAAYTSDELEHLYVDPCRHGQGIGTRLFNQVAQRIGADFEFWVFQANAARGFYEHLGCKMLYETDGADNMEKCPDARYRYSA